MNIPYHQIILQELDKIDLKKKIVIYPFGEQGRLTKNILNGLYGIQEFMIVDNYLSESEERIKSLEDLAKENLENVLILIASDRRDIHEELLRRLCEIVPSSEYKELFTEFTGEHVKYNHGCSRALFYKIDLTGIEENNMQYSPSKTKSVFFLPYIYTDFIQQLIFITDDYFEVKNLNYVFNEFKDGVIRDEISAEGICIDVGANIGNHTLFMANEVNAKKIIAFEPIYETFRILKKNIRINGLEEKVIPHNVGCADVKGNAALEKYDYENIGGTGLVLNDGSIPLITLDDFDFGEEVKFIKIDVEGMELCVLKGSSELIRKYHPYIMVESFSKQSRQVKNYLNSFGYSCVQLDDSNYLFY